MLQCDKMGTDCRQGLQRVSGDAGPNEVDSFTEILISIFIYHYYSNIVQFFTSKQESSPRNSVLFENTDLAFKFFFVPHIVSHRI